MSLKKNIFASYVSQLYVTLVGIIMVPLYVKYMGAESYGLVGFYAMLQAWFQLLDMGLTPTMARETARFRGGAIGALSLRRLLRALEGIFFGVGFLGATAMIVGAGTIASMWLQVEQLPLYEVQHAIILMAFIVALRWMCGLYRGAINGFECMIWLGGFNVAVATVRFVFVIPFFIYVGNSPSKFFLYQLFIAFIEIVVLLNKAYSLLPKLDTAQKIPWQLESLKRISKFSLTIAFTSSMWVLVRQADKLILSKLLSLSNYAYFTLSVLVASGVMIVSGPISSALLPRMTKMNAEGDYAGLISLYRKATQTVGVIVVPAAMVLALFAEKVLWAWTGDVEITQVAAPVLSLYALGNGILALSAFPYYLQFAKGDLKQHLIGNVLFFLLLVPAVIWATWRFGIIGAGYAWLGANAVYFVVWVPKVHGQFLKGLHTQWLLKDIGLIVLPVTVGGVLTRCVMKWPEERLLVAIILFFLSLIFLATTSVSSSLIRSRIYSKLFRTGKNYDPSYLP